jgi:hypothetical protein
MIELHFCVRTANTDIYAGGEVKAEPERDLPVELKTVRFKARVASGEAPKSPPQGASLFLP